jgi:hypothetical protein
MTQEQNICSFTIDDEESSRQSLAPNHQFNINCPLGLRCIATEVFQYHICF